MNCLLISLVLYKSWEFAVKICKNITKIKHISMSSRFTVLWLVLVRSEDRLPRLRPKRRKRRRPAAPRDASSTTGGSSTWLPPSVARRDPTLTRKSRGSSQLAFSFSCRSVKYILIFVKSMSSEPSNWVFLFPLEWVFLSRDEGTRFFSIGFSRKLWFWGQ